MEVRGQLSRVAFLTLQIELNLKVVRLGLCHLTGSSCLFLCSLRSKNVSYNFWCLEKNEASCFRLQIK